MSEDKFDRYHGRMNDLERVVNDQVDEIEKLKAQRELMVNDFKLLVNHVSTLTKFMRKNNLDPANAYENPGAGARFCFSLMKALKNYTNCITEENNNMADFNYYEPINAELEEAFLEREEQIKKLQNNELEMDPWILKALANATQSEK